MIRRDPEYWQRLRKDKRSNGAVLLTALALLAASVSLTMVTVPGSQPEARSNPVYWLILVPVAWWISNLAAFEPGAVRVWKPALALACAVSAVCLGLAIAAGAQVVLPAIECAVTLAAAGGAIAAHRNSLVAREGPAR